MVKTPDLTFKIDNITYTVPAQALVEVVAPNICMLNLQKSAMLHTTWVLGLNFLRGYYTVLDATNQKVGFGQSTMSQGALVLPQSLSYQTV